MKRSNRKRHRPEEVAAKPRQADEALAKGTPIAEVARSLGVSDVTLHGRERHRAPKGDEDIVTVLDELTAIRGAPAHIRADNGPEMISKAVKAWCEESGTGALYIEPGSPWQNGIGESFNGRLREELLSSEIFDTLAEARYLIDRLRLFYNHRRSGRLAR